MTEDVENLVDLYKDAAAAIKEKGGEWLRETVEHDVAEKVTKGKTTIVRNYHTSLCNVLFYFCKSLSKVIQ